MQKKITFDSFIRGVLTALIVFGVLYLINKLSGVLLPFFVAWLIAYLLYPFVTFVQYKLKFKNRVLSIFAVMLLFFCVIALIIWGVIPPLIDEFSKVQNLITVYFIEGTKQAEIPGTVANFIKEHIDMIKIEEALSLENVGNILQKGVPQVWAFLAGSMNVIISVFASFIVLIYMFFILHFFYSNIHTIFNYTFNIFIIF